jgi:hypothetical protein
MTACVCEFTRDYDPLKNPQGGVWRLVSADKVPAGAETAPMGTPAAEATPATEQGEEMATPET